MARSFTTNFSAKVKTTPIIRRNYTLSIPPRYHTPALRSFLTTTRAPVLTNKMAPVPAEDGAETAAPPSSFTEEEMKEDPYLYLEEVESERALTWVKEQNKITLDKVVSKTAASGNKYTKIVIEDTEEYKRSLQILDSKDKIAHVRKIGSYYYNFWRDEKHVKGIWRRTSFAEYGGKQDPESVEWETVLDLDELSKKEDKSWVWSGYSLLPELGLMEVDSGSTNEVEICNTNFPYMYKMHHKFRQFGL